MLKEGGKMGYDLKGRNLGKYLSQKKDGSYRLRYKTKKNQVIDKQAKTLKLIKLELEKLQKNDLLDMSNINSKTTLDQWFDIWLNTIKVNLMQSSRNNTQTYYNRIKKDLGWRTLDKLSLVVIQDAFNKIPTEHSRKTTKITLVDCLNSAVEQGLIYKNPAKRIVVKLANSLDSKEDDDVKYLTIQETRQLLEFCNEVDYHYLNLFEFTLQTGLRVGELCALEWSDVDFKRKRVYVNKSLAYVQQPDKKMKLELHPTKTKAGVRYVPLTAKAIESLNKQLILHEKVSNERKTDLPNVFINKCGRLLNPFQLGDNLRKRFLGRIREHYPSFQNLSPHMLRHTFATRCIEAGMNPKALQKILGHERLETTMDLYVHATEEFKEEEIVKLESYFDKLDNNSNIIPLKKYG